MAVVLEQKIGNTQICIHDDYCRNTTPEQVENILKRIALRAKAEFSAAAQREAEKEKGIG